MIKVLLADDQNIVRNGIRNLLENDGRFEITGEASSAGTVFEVLDKGVYPEIILADLQMPDLITLTQNFRVDGTTFPKVVLLTTVDDEKTIVNALKSGAMAYLLKNIGADELIFALLQVHQDKKYMSSELAFRLLDRVSNLPQLNHYQSDGVSFSKRETEVLELISEGLTNQQIANKLFTSRRTVEGHRQALMGKANVHNSAALVKFAFRHNLLRDIGQKSSISA